MTIFVHEPLLPKIKRDSILNMLKSGKRSDGRGFSDLRDMRIKPNIIDNADGSAEVWLGDTYVITGVKLSLGTPYSDEPEKGVLIVNSEFPPVASPTFEPGPPDENAIELARVVDRVLRESNFIKLDELCIVPGQKVWILWVDIYILNHDGNLIDASEIASVAALMSTKVPEVTVLNGEIRIEKENKKPLPLNTPPVALTHAKVGDYLIVDPNFEEELIMDSRFTIGLTADNKICAMQKGGLGSFKVKDLEKMIANSLNIAPRIRELIMKSVRENG